MKASKERIARMKRVEAALGDSVICRRCGATLATYDQKCNAPLDVRCEGFETVERAGKAA